MEKQEHTTSSHLKFVTVIALCASFVVTVILWLFVDQDQSTRLVIITNISVAITFMLIGSTTLIFCHYELMGFWVLIVALVSAILAAAIFLSGATTPLIISAALTIFIIAVQSLPRWQSISASVLMGLAVLTAMLINISGFGYPLTIADSTSRWLENLQMSVIVIFMLLILREALQRSQIEMELKQQNVILALNEQKYRQLVEHAGDIVYTTDAKGLLTYVNPSAAKWTGYDQEQLLGRHFTSLMPPEWRPRAEAFYQRQWQQGHRETVYEFPVQVAGGFTRWAQQRTAVLMDGDDQLVGYHSVIRDISKRRMMEEALQSELVKTEAMYQMARSLISYRKLPDLLQTVTNAIASALSASRTILYTFDLKQHHVEHFVTGGPRADLVVPVTFEVLMVGVDGWVLHHGQAALIYKHVADKRMNPAMHQQRTALDIGSMIVSPVRYQGMILGTLTAINCLDDPDFTDEDVELMMALGNQAGMALENVRLYGVERQYIEELRAQNEELDAFSHTVAHDLFSPLSAVLGFMDILSDTYETGAAVERQKALLAEMRGVSHQMVNIIDELLLLAQIRKADVQIEVVDMQWIMADVWQRLMYMTEEYGAELVVPSNWPKVAGYGPWIAEIWVNYVSNALKYGGRPPRVELGYTAEREQEVRFWVRDNGKGLTPEAQTNLFTPFERLNQLNIEGHGLGLSIVRRIVEKLGGTVGVESEVGQGSLFFFTLSLVEE